MPLIAAAIVALSAPLQASLTFTTKSLPFGGVNQSYFATLSATGSGGVYLLLTGALPAGLVYDPTAQEILGTPLVAGAFRLTLLASDGANDMGQESLTLYIMQISTPPRLPNGSVCSPYSQTFAVSDAPPPPFIWTLVAPNPLPGLTLDASAGVLSGTPTSGGRFNFNIEALSSSTGVFAVQNVFLDIASFCLVPTLPNGDLNSMYRAPVALMGGNAPFTWTVSGNLPLGVGIDSTSGLLSGTPTVPGKYTFTVQVTDSTADTVTQAFSITINPALAFTTASPLAQGTAGANYSQTFAATGGSPPYIFTSSNPPTGLQLSPTGVLSGSPSSGNFTVPVTVTDSLNNSVGMDFAVSFVNPTLLEVSPAVLGFSAILGGDAPAPKSINVIPVGTPSNFTVLVDGGAGIPAPSWITVTPLAAAGAPATLVVAVNQGTLAVHSAQARIQVIDGSGTAIVVLVTLEIVSAPPRLQLVPDTLHFAARAGTPGTLVETLGISNAGGGGSISFNASVVGGGSWVISVTPSSGQTAPNSTVFVQVQINTQGLQVGSYHDVIQFSSGAAIVSVPIALFVSGGGAILQLSATGERFQARSGGGFSNPLTLEILNTGDPASSLTWTAEFVSGSRYFSSSASDGNATLTSPGSLTLTPTSAALQMPAGGYYGLLKISSKEALNSPLYAVLVLDLEDPSTPALPDPSPAGLVFIGTAGQPLSAIQTLNINTSAASPVPFQVSASTADGGNWLTVSPTSGSAGGQSPEPVTLSVDPTKLAAGIHSAEVDVSMSGALRSVNVTTIVQPGGSNPVNSAGASTVNAVQTSCTPSSLVLTETGLVNNFAVPAGWPATLMVLLNDDCGNTISDGFVNAVFSNGDAPLTLHEAQTGTYSVTWQPHAAAAQMALSIQAYSTKLKPAMIQLVGAVNENQNAPPIIFENGMVNAFNRVSAGALAPGMIVEVYGSGLATTGGNPGVLPLTTDFDGTSLIVGSRQAPLYYVSDTQLNVQFNVELTANQQYAVIASLNGALSVPVVADVSPIQLGVAATVDGMVVAQHGDTATSITEDSPAKPGEVVVIYLSGMGATNPSVKSGEPAPSSAPFAKVIFPATVTLDGQAATVQFAGLAPNFVGLYQVNFRVPVSAATGDQTLIVSQNGVSSNATRLPVSQ
jgi:uncharacterized protein (TIGR03437 family)